MNEAAHRAVDDVEGDRWAAIQACRDRALASVLSYTGIRIGELVRHLEDERRDGIRWSDVDLEEGRVTVLSKKQGWTTARSRNRRIMR